MVEARTHSFHIKLPTGSSEYAWGLSQAGAVSKYTFLKVAFDIWKGKKKLKMANMQKNPPSVGYPSMVIPGFSAAV